MGTKLTSRLKFDETLFSPGLLIDGNLLSIHVVGDGENSPSRRTRTSAELL